MYDKSSTVKCRINARYETAPRIWLRKYLNGRLTEKKEKVTNVPAATLEIVVKSGGLKEDGDFCLGIVLVMIESLLT